MRRAILNGLLLLFVTVPLAAQTRDWKPYSSTAGNFTALFPGAPTDRLNGKDEMVDSHTIGLAQPPYAYSVGYSRFTTDQVVTDANYEIAKKNLLAGLGSCKVDEEKSAPAIKGYIGHWYRLTCDYQSKVTMSGNFYFGKHYAYAVMVLYGGNTGPVPGEKKFLDSFAVIDAPR